MLQVACSVSLVEAQSGILLVIILLLISYFVWIGVLDSVAVERPQADGVF